MQTFLVAGGAVIAVFGSVELAWAIRSDVPRYMVAQGLFFIELGLAFLAQGLISEGVMRSSIAGAFLVSALLTAVAQHKLQRDAKRERARNQH